MFDYRKKQAELVFDDPSFLKDDSFFLTLTMIQKKLPEIGNGH